jgi:tRNA(Phe) wybutosine-synthesizing methylase Tyw3
MVDYNMIDPEIRDLVKIMYKHKYYTKFSCSGHINDPRIFPAGGYLWFRKSYSITDLRKIITILEKYGLKNIKVYFKNPANLTRSSLVMFKPIGKPYIKVNGRWKMSK